MGIEFEVTIAQYTGLNFSNRVPFVQWLSSANDVECRAELVTLDRMIPDSITQTSFSFYHSLSCRAIDNDQINFPELRGVGET